MLPINEMARKYARSIYISILISTTAAIIYYGVILESFTAPLILLSLILHSLAGRFNAKKEAVVNAIILFIVVGYLAFFKYQVFGGDRGGI